MNTKDKEDLLNEAFVSEARPEGLRPVTLKTFAMMSRTGIELRLGGALGDTAVIVYVLAAPEKEVAQTVYREPLELEARADEFLGTLTPRRFAEYCAAINRDLQAIEEAQVALAKETAAGNAASPRS